MYKDPVLEEKWHTQRALSRAANYNIKTLMDTAHKDVLKISKELKIKPKYFSL